ncbi:MAG: glycosyltransferase family 2 protein [Gammaproteobacteria bacterium]|jgi:dolichol-phosphate mannosyltransferase
MEPSAHPDKASDGNAVSVVVPIHNEAANIETLYGEIRSVLEPRCGFEVLVVDDGSDDDSDSVLSTLAGTEPRMRRLGHPVRRGQSAALRTGVAAARHERIVTLDGDGQNDPRDIPLLLETLDRSPLPARRLLVIGHRLRREDSLIKRLASRVANAVRQRMLRDQTPDTGCGLKVFARSTFLSLPYFDHMHRFLPALIRRAGGEVVSVPVRHRPRKAGRSKYGTLDRLWAGIVDLLGVIWLIRRCPADYSLLPPDAGPAEAARPATPTTPPERR